MNSDCSKALAFWTVGIQYLHLVQCVSDEIQKQGNVHVLISDGPISTDEYNEKTKWSDHGLVIPLLFNLFHGLEVILKGFLCAKGRQFGVSHKLSQLLSDFKAEYPSSSLVPLFEKYIENAHLPSILSDFCNESRITIDEYYQALKYPEGTSGNQYQHYSLKYKGEEGSSFFSALRDDIEILRMESVRLSRQICPNA